MKIGILTIHFPYNYGAMLQAYALKEFLITHKIDAHIIDYRPYHIDKDYRFKWRLALSHPKQFLRRFFKNEHIDRTSFESFLSNYILDGKSNNYDCVIVGSDQVWNPNITNYDENYLLKNKKWNSVSKISFASSIALNTIDSKWEESLKKYLVKFDFLSAREKEDCLFLKRILGKDVFQACDPTFLISKEQWIKCERTPRFLCPEKYILLYALEYNDELVAKANYLKNQTGLPIVTIHPFKNIFVSSDYFDNSSGPMEFLWLIDHAKYVVTNSFHGTVFSLIFGKPFYVIPHSKTGKRMKSLLETLKINKTDSLGMYSKQLDGISLEESIYIKESKEWIVESINHFVKGDCS